MTRTPEPLGEERGALPGALPIVRSDPRRNAPDELHLGLLLERIYAGHLKHH